MTDYVEMEDDKQADVLVESYMKIFGLESIETKFACCVDGLIKAQRRILWTLGTTENKLRVVRLAGQVMEYHPHGDGSISSSIIKLSQPFSNIVPLIKALGSTGNFGGESAASPRYLDVVSAPFTRDVFFNGTNLNALIMLRVDNHLEPKYFIPKIPVALIMGSVGMAPGFKSDAISLGFYETCKLAEEFVKVKGSTPRYKEHYKRLSQYLIPDHPAHSILRNKDVLIEAAQNKIFNTKILADGILNITPSSITIRSLPFVNNMKSDEDRIHQIRKTKNNWFDKYIQELCGGPDGEMWGDIVFKLKRGVDPFVILDEFKKRINFTRTFSPINTWLNKDGLMEENFSPFDILETWYNERFKYIRVELKHTQTKLIIDYRKLEALIIVVDHEDEVHAIFKHADDTTDTIKPLCTKFGLSEFQAKYLASLTYAQITKQGRGELTRKKNEVSVKIANLQKEFSSINNRILNEVIEIKNKYDHDVNRRMALPDYIGYVKIGDCGIIQYSSDKEMLNLIDTFGTDKTQIYRYPSCKYYKGFIKNNSVEIENDIKFAKQLSGVKLEILTYKPKGVVCYNKSNSYKIDIDNFKGHDVSDVDYCLVGNKCIFVTKRGVVELSSINKFVDRVSSTNTGVADSILHVSPIVDKSIIVIHVNSKEKNCLRIDLLDLSQEAKLSKIPVGKTKILYVGKSTDSIYCSVPSYFVYRCRVNHIVINNPLEFMNGKKSVRLYLNTKSTDAGKKLKKFLKHNNVCCY